MLEVGLRCLSDMEVGSLESPGKERSLGPDMTGLDMSARGWAVGELGLG